MAEIAKYTTDYEIGYHLTPQTGFSLEENYTYATRVDGDNKYGMPWYCFPRRAQVGGALYLSGNNVVGNGSRSIYAQTNTAFTNGHRSI